MISPISKRWAAVRLLISALAVLFLMSAVAFAQADWTRRFPTHSPSKRMKTATAQFGDGSRVVLFGGLNLGPPGSFNEFNVLGDTWFWDGNDWTQATTSAAPPARYGASMAYDPGRQTTVLFGGEDSLGRFFSDTWEFGLHLSCKACIPALS